MIEGGWLDERLMKIGSSLGFLYGLQVPLVRSKVKSRKFVHCWFICAVIFKPRLSNTRMMSLRTLSHSLPDLVLITAKPTSRYTL